LSQQIRDAVIELALMFRSACSDRTRWQKISAATFKLEVKAYKCALAESQQQRSGSQFPAEKLARGQLVAYAARHLSAAAVDLSGETVAKDAAAHAPACSVQKSKLLELLREAR
jgi:hypothetical protein